MNYVENEDGIEQQAEILKVNRAFSQSDGTLHVILRNGQTVAVRFYHPNCAADDKVPPHCSVSMESGDRNRPGVYGFAEMEL